MKDWKTLKVQDIASAQKNALVGGPFGSNLITSDYVENGVPVIRGQNMGQGRWVTGNFAFVTNEKAQSLKANIARPGDLVFTQRGTLGQVSIIPRGEFKEYLISQSENLAEIRYSLLPRLILGKIKVGESIQVLEMEAA